MDRQWRYKSRVKSFRSNYPRYFHQQNPLSITFHSTPPLRGGGGGAFKGGGSTPRPRKLSPFRFIFELTPIKRRSRIVWFRRLERAFIKEKQLRLTKVSGASPARRKREVEDKKGKARSVLERNRAKTKGARGNEGGRTMKRSQFVMVATMGSVMYARLGRKPAKRSSPIALPHVLCIHVTNYC